MRKRNRLLIILLPLASLLFAELMLPGGLLRRVVGTGNDDHGVNVVEERRGGSTHLIVTTTNCLDITISLAADLHNMRSSPALPITLETRGQRRIEIASLEPLDPGKPWDYHYSYHWRFGGRGGQPDGEPYALPFDSAGRHKLIQGYQGRFSHEAGSPNEFSHDWDLEEGTTVLAARGGVVVGVRQDSNAHGVGDRFLSSANYVIIRHSDGTYGEYLHLKQQGSLVQLGDTVKTGQAIALSGDTGYSTRPHLHFDVFRAIDGSTRESLPVKFITKDGTVQLLEEGKTY